MMELIFFYIFAALSVIGALGVALMPNIFHAALSLILVLLMGAAFFVMLSAEFIAVAQVLIYAGAIVVLLVFAVMLTKKIQTGTMRSHNEQIGMSAVVATSASGLIIWCALRASWPLTPGAHTGGIAEIGKLLLGQYILPFELVSVVLLLALIGGIIIARDS